MFRSLICTLSVFALCLGSASADDKKDTKDKKDKHTSATITKVDPKHHTVTVKMKGKDGKETEKEFKLVEEARYLDSNGNVAAMEVFKSGDYVLIVEEDGKIKEMKQDKKNDGDKPKTDKKSGNK